MDAASGESAITSWPGERPVITARPVTGPNEATMTDDELRCQVAAELSWDPRVDSEAVEVYADSGTVTLRGTVASLRQNRAASKAAARVRGVIRPQERGGSCQALVDEGEGELLEVMAGGVGDVA
jgi:osmotically-inducible protein OsmY